MAGGTTRKNYKDEYFEEKFRSLEAALHGQMTVMNAHFENVEDQLERIENHAALTNSRVTHAEADIKAVNGRIDKAMEWANHVVDTRPKGCPSIEKIAVLETEMSQCKKDFEGKIDELEDSVEGKVDELKGKLEDVFFFARHPKLFVAILVAAVLLSLATFVTNKPFAIFAKQKTAEQVVNTNNQ